MIYFWMIMSIPTLLIALMLVVSWGMGLIDDTIGWYLEKKQMRKDFSMFQIHYKEFLEYKADYDKFFEWKVNRDS